MLGLVRRNGVCCFIFSIASINTLATLNTAKAADFIMNFQPNPLARPGMIDSWGQSICNFGTNGPCRSSFQGPAEPTPFVYELVDIDGVDFVHMIIGDPTTGFVQETYATGTASAVGQTAGAYAVTEGGRPVNGPGQASANPARIAIRQQITDAEITMEFLKDTLANKPRISQDIITPEMTSIFNIDMRNISYLDDTANASFTNQFSFTNAPIANFDFATQTDPDKVQVTAGQYIYVDGSGLYGSEGSYQYKDPNGGFNLDTIDWCMFWDPSQNTFAASCQ